MAAADESPGGALCGPHGHGQIRCALSVRLRRHPQVWRQLGVALRELLPDYGNPVRRVNRARATKCHTTEGPLLDENSAVVADNTGD